MKHPIKNIGRLIAAVEIKNVRLVEANLRSTIRSVKAAGKVSLTLNGSAKVKEPLRKGTFYVLAEIDAKLIPSNQKQKPAVSVRAVYELEYKLPARMSVSKQELNEFARVNGVFNVWPYWREFIHNSVVRMHLPAVVLPVFRLSQVSDDTKKVSAKSK